MICRRWQTDLHRKAFVLHCLDISPTSPSLGRRSGILFINPKTSYRETTLLFFFLSLQDLPAEKVEDDLIEKGQEEEILQKSCPEEFQDLKEEEVLTRRLRHSLDKSDGFVQESAT